MLFINQHSVRQDYYEVLWVSARQPVKGVGQPQLMEEELNFTLDDVTSRLAKQLGLSHLSEKPLEDRLKGIQAATALQKYLLVVDNLETVSDYVEVVPALARYCGQCKILITTRESLREFPFVTVFQVPELSQYHASQLVNEEVRRRGGTSQISSPDLEILFKTVGGLPLALKLVAAQVQLNPVAEIMNEFKRQKEEKNQFTVSCIGRFGILYLIPLEDVLFTFLTADPEGEDTRFLGY